jgi:cytochrome c oxidase assembly protein subunit 11
MLTLALPADRNNRIALLVVLLPLAMLALGFASPPLYRWICEVTGMGGTTQRAAAGQDAPGAVTGKIVNVRFDANINDGLPWRFAPEQGLERTAVGARKMVFYNAKNESSVPVTGTATFNVTPESAGKYFTKIQCFCFNLQTLQPGESIRMPVIYYVDPAILTDPDARKIEEITLSYTFFPVDSAKQGG